MAKRKINVGILFGGKSAEHEVSLRSARNVIEALDRSKYHPVLIAIDKSGAWRLSHERHLLPDPKNPERIRLAPDGESIALVPHSEGRISRVCGEDVEGPLDVCFPILHGPFGEDGTIQGLLKLADIPFVGSGVLGSAIGMDKEVSKRLLREAGIPVARFMVLRSEDAPPRFAQVVENLGSPFFVKPANMGSSVGVSKVKSETQFTHAVEEAFAYDTKAIVEEYIAGREIECSVLGNNDPIASVPGEILPSHEFYSYEAKYLDEKGAALEIPAKIPDQVAQRIRELAVAAFRALMCEGLGRVDFFLRDNGEILVNEINTIPGFTSISMYPKLWEASGISYSELIDRLIGLAFERFQRERRLMTTYAG